MRGHGRAIQPLTTCQKFAVFMMTRKCKVDFYREFGRNRIFYMNRGCCSLLIEMNTAIVCYNAHVIEEEIEYAEELQKELACQQRSEERKHKVEEKRDEVQARFEVLKEKLKSQLYKSCTYRQQAN